MRYYSVWRQLGSKFRLAGFGVLFLLVILLGLSIRHARQHAPQASLEAVIAAVQTDLNHVKQYQTSREQKLALAEENIPQHVAGYSFTLSSNAQPSLIITAKPLFASPATAPRSTLVTDRIESTLREQGFTLTSSGSAPVLDHEAVQIRYLRDKQDLCTITAHSSRYQIVLQCSNPQTWLRQAQTAQPLVDAYLAQHIEVRVEDVVFGQLDKTGTTAEAVIYRPGAAKGQRVLFSQQGGHWEFLYESELRMPDTER